MLAALRKTAPNTTQFNILGAYFDDTSVERIRQWKISMVIRILVMKWYMDVTMKSAMVILTSIALGM